MVGELGIQPVSRRSPFRSLARCIERGYRDKVAAACLSQATTGGDLSLCLYDVTTLYSGPQGGACPSSTPSSRT